MGMSVAPSMTTVQCMYLLVCGVKMFAIFINL